MECKLDDSLDINIAGYKGEGMKLNQLKHYYWNDDSVSRAQSDYAEVVKGGKYKSVGVSTHGTPKKGFTKQGFCIQAYTLTLIPGRTTEMDVFYRTTEAIKKFAADLVYFNQFVVPAFDFTEAPLTKVRFHFSNLTLHPMFMWLLIPHIAYKSTMKEIKEVDPGYYTSVLRWMKLYLSHGEIKFKQAERSRDQAQELLSEKCQNYFRKLILEELK